MSLATQLWLARGRLRQVRARTGAQARRARGRLHRDEWISRYVPGTSFADIGCMWGSHAEIAFRAEAAGATAVTAVDIMGETPEFRAEHQRRQSAVRFVQGDLHDPDTVARTGPHGVVWCMGILCVDESPVLTLTRLRAMTTNLLIVDAATVPEVPGIPQAAVFYPGMSDAERRAYRRTNPGGRKGLTTPFDPARPAGSWWWGLTPSAFRGMLFSVGLEPIEWHDEGFRVTVVARVIRT